MNTEENRGTEYSQIGTIISRERTRAGVSAQQLCAGVCSRSYLARIETGERGCEKIVSEALLQRLGVSQERFLYFLNTREQEWLCAREDLAAAVDSGQEKEYRRAREEYIRLTKGQSRLHEQFRMLAESVWDFRARRETAGDLERIAEKLRQAWSVTMPARLLEGTQPLRMSHIELSIKCLYLRILEETGKSGEALSGYRKLLRHLGKGLLGREKAAFSVQIGYRILVLLEQSGRETDESAGIYASCMEEIRRQGSLFYLRELTEYRLRHLPADGAHQERSRAEQLCASLRWLYGEYDVRPGEWIWYLTDDVEETYVLADLIKGRRQALGMTQEALAEGVCNPVTVSRIESGAVVPKQGVLTGLLKKLNLPGGSIVMSAQTGNAGLHRTVEEINMLTRFGRNEEALPLVKKLVREAGHSRYADQYLLALETLTLYGTGKIDAETEQKRLWDALHITVPDKEPEHLGSWYFTKAEATIVNGISYGCEKVGQRDRGIVWLRLLLQYYDKLDPERRKGMDNYERALRNLGDLLGNRQEYMEAIQAEDIAIRMALVTGKADVLRLTLYDRTWNMEQLQEGDDEEKRRCFMKAALSLAYLFSDSDEVIFLEQHWKELYDN